MGGDQVKEYEMGGTCSIHERCEVHTEFWSENLKGKDCLLDLGIDGRIILQ